MKQAVNEKDVLNLLSNLKTMGGSYPSDMIQSRRDLYIKQAAAMAVLTKTTGNGNGGGTNTGGGSGMAATGGAAGSLSLGKFLEAALVVAIAVEAGVAAYIYRDKIADFIDANISPKVEVAANPTEDYSGTPAIVPLTGDESISETPTETPTVTVTETDTPSISNDGVPENNNGSSIQEPLSTPAPTDNPGNHYGNTPRPERTKDTTNNTNNSSQETKDKAKD